MNSSSKQQTFSFISSAVPPEHEVSVVFGKSLFTLTTLIKAMICTVLAIRRRDANSDRFSFKS